MHEMKMVGEPVWSGEWEREMARSYERRGRGLEGEVRPRGGEVAAARQARRILGVGSVREEEG